MEPDETPIGHYVQKWNHVFNGKTDALTFLERLEELQETHGFSNKQLLTALPEMLRESALMWYRNNKSTIKTWDDFLKQFMNFYLPNDYVFNLEEEINNRRQRVGEKGRDYVTALQTLIRRHGGYSQNQILFRIYNNLRPEYRRYIRRSAMKSIDDLVQEIKEYEKLHEELERKSTSSHFVPRNNPPPQTKTPPQPGPSGDNNQARTNFFKPNRPKTGPNVFCYRCDTAGHLSSFCDNPRKIYCFVCKKEGVTTQQCCRKNQEN